MSASDQPPAPVLDDSEKSRSVWNAPFVIISAAFILVGGFKVVFGPAKDDIASDLGVSLAEVMATRTTTAFINADQLVDGAELAIALANWTP